MNSETKLMHQIQVRASYLGYRLFRNNVGLAWVGRAVPIRGVTHVLLRYARRIRMGFCPGSSDLIGWKPRIITQEMVGSVIAQFVAREVKTETGRPAKAQVAFIDMVNAAGGDGKFITGPDQMP